MSTPKQIALWSVLAREKPARQTGVTTWKEPSSEVRGDGCSGEDDEGTHPHPPPPGILLLPSILLPGDNTATESGMEQTMSEVFRRLESGEAPADVARDFVARAGAGGGGDAAITAENTAAVTGLAQQHAELTLQAGLPAAGAVAGLAGSVEQQQRQQQQQSR
jgi:hypothetical protein